MKEFRRVSGCGNRSPERTDRAHLGWLGSSFVSTTRRMSGRWACTFGRTLSGSFPGVMRKEMGVNFQPTKQRQIDHCGFSLRRSASRSSLRTSTDRTQNFHLKRTDRQQEPYHEKEYLHAYLPSEKPMGLEGLPIRYIDWVLPGYFQANLFAWFVKCLDQHNRGKCARS